MFKSQAEINHYEIAARLTKLRDTNSIIRAFCAAAAKDGHYDIQTINNWPRPTRQQLLNKLDIHQIHDDSNTFYDGKQCHLVVSKNPGYKWSQYHYVSSYVDARKFLEHKIPHEIYIEYDLDSTSNGYDVAKLLISLYHNASGRFKYGFKYYSNHQHIRGILDAYTEHLDKS